MPLGKKLFPLWVHLLKHLLIAHESLVSTFSVFENRKDWWNEWKCFLCYRPIRTDLSACHSGASIRCAKCMLQKLLVYLLSNYIPGQRFLVTATESLSGKSEFIHTEERWLFDDQGWDETRRCYSCKTWTSCAITPFRGVKTLLR